MVLNTKVRQYFELFQNLTQRDLKGKYKRTVFGQLWSFANPLALMLVYTFVFSFVIRIQIPHGNPSGLNNFPIWLLCGLLPWIFFSTVLIQSMDSLVKNESLIRKVYFPRNILIFSTVAAAATNWSFEMLVLLAALIVSGSIASLLFAPVALIYMIMLVVFATGLSLMLSIANVYFRDTQHFVAIALQLGMYLSPVVYPITLVEEQSEKIGTLFGGVTLLGLYSLNPMERFIVAFRQALYDNTFPSLGDFLFCLLASAITFAIGWIVFSKNQRKLAEIL